MHKPKIDNVYHVLLDGIRIQISEKEFNRLKEETELIQSESSTSNLLGKDVAYHWLQKDWFCIKGGQKGGRESIPKNEKSPVNNS